MTMQTWKNYETKIKSSSRKNPEKFSNTADKALYFMLNDMAQENIGVVERLVKTKASKRNYDDMQVPELITTVIFAKAYAATGRRKFKIIKKHKE